MDLRSPLRTLSPGLDSAVLEVLAGTESALSATQIARLSSRGTRTGQRPVLERLVDHGLVITQPGNLGVLYRLNRAHVLAPAVLGAAAARDAVLRILAEAVGALSPAPVHASVFGSFARREADADSDIDLMLVVPDGTDVHDAGWSQQIRDLEDAVLAASGNRLEVLVLSPERLTALHRSGEAIVRTWSKDAVDVHGVPVRALLPTGDRTPR
ncbi:nucleotidyltransferase domain-containing protein [Thalassiella azotivora]